MSITVIAVNGMTANDPSVEYIGRAWSGWKPSVLANPKSLNGGKRGSTLPSYLVWLREEWRKDGAVKTELLRLAKLVKEGRDVRLGCWCKAHGPDTPCHGDTVKMVVETLIEKGIV